MNQRILCLSMAVIALLTLIEVRAAGEEPSGFGDAKLNPDYNQYSRSSRVRSLAFGWISIGIASISR